MDAYDPTVKQKAREKTQRAYGRIPIAVAAPVEKLRKPDWIRVRAGGAASTQRFYEIKQILREHKLHTVCEEA